MSFTVGYTYLQVRYIHCTLFLQAVDVVGQAGKPKTITGFQTHTTPVLLAYGERAELATEECILIHSSTCWKTTACSYVLVKNNQKKISMISISYQVSIE